MGRIQSIIGLDLMLIMMIIIIIIILIMLQSIMGKNLSTTYWTLHVMQQ